MAACQSSPKAVHSEATSHEHDVSGAVLEISNHQSVALSFTKTLARRSTSSVTYLLIAATARESVNLMSGQLARHVMRIPLVVCLVKDSNLLPVYENLGIKVINPDGLLMEAIKDGLD